MHPTEEIMIKVLLDDYGFADKLLVGEEGYPEYPGMFDHIRPFKVYKTFEGAEAKELYKKLSFRKEKK